MDSTAGITFLGTPFQGTHETFGAAVDIRVLVALEAGGQGANKLVHYLRKEDGGHKELDELVQVFREMVNSRSVPIVCFYERQRSDFRVLRERLPSDYNHLQLEDFGIVSL